MAAGDAVARLHDGHVIEAAATLCSRAAVRPVIPAPMMQILWSGRRLSDAAGLLLPAGGNRTTNRAGLITAALAPEVCSAAAASCAARCAGSYSCAIVIVFPF